MAEITIWGIHAGREGEADNLFTKNRVIAIGWSEIGSLSEYHDRDEYKRRGRWKIATVLSFLLGTFFLKTLPGFRQPENDSNSRQS